MSAPDGARDLFAGILGTWERSAARIAGAAVRDPRLLALGARMLESQLLWRRAWEDACAAAWAPFAAPAEEK